MRRKEQMNESICKEVMNFDACVILKFVTLDNQK